MRAIWIFSACQRALHRLAGLAQFGEFGLDAGQAFARAPVVLAAQRLLLDLELDDPALHLVDLLGEGIDLDAQPAPRLVHQVDRLVGEEPSSHVAVRQSGRRDQRVVGDAHAMVDFVPLPDAAQDGDGVLDGGGGHVDGLEAALQGGVLLDVLAVLAQGGGADHAEVAAGQGRLDHVAGVDGALGPRPPPTIDVQFVDEEDVVPVGLGDLLDHGLHALLEVATVLRTREHGGDVERDELLAAERGGHVAPHDALRQPLGDRGLADAGLADEHGIVLGAAGQDLHDAADLVVAADDRVELAAAGALGEGRGSSGPAPGTCPPGSGSVTRWEPRMASSAVSRRARVTPWSLRMRAASPLPAVRPMRRCSVET